MLIYFAEAHLLGGDTNRAEGLAARGLALAGDRGFVWGVAAAERLLGRIARAQGALLDARRHLEQALEIFAGVPARFEVALTKLNLAAVAHAQGRAGDACAYLDDALPALRNQGAARALEAGEQLLEAIRPLSGGTPR